VEASETTPTFSVGDGTDTGKEVAFAKLSMADIFRRIVPAEAKRRRESLLQNLRDAGNTPGEIVAELENHDALWRKADLNLFFGEMLDAIDGRLSLLEFLYRKLHGQEANLPDSMTPEAMLKALNQALEPFGISYGVPATPGAASQGESPTEAAKTVPSGDLPPDVKVPEGQPQPLRGYGSEVPLPAHPPRLRGYGS
jgi:hypothetical protein